MAAPSEPASRKQAAIATSSLLVATCLFAASSWLWQAGSLLLSTGGSCAAVALATASSCARVRRGGGSAAATAANVATSVNGTNQMTRIGAALHDAPGCVQPRQPRDQVRALSAHQTANAQPAYVARPVSAISAGVGGAG